MSARSYLQELLSFTYTSNNLMNMRRRNQPRGDQGIEPLCDQLRTLESDQGAAGNSERKEELCSPLHIVSSTLYADLRIWKSTTRGIAVVEERRGECAAFQ